MLTYIDRIGYTQQGTKGGLVNLPRILDSLYKSHADAARPVLLAVGILSLVAFFSCFSSTAAVCLCVSFSSFSFPPLVALIHCFDIVLCRRPHLVWHILLDHMRCVSAGRRRQTSRSHLLLIQWSLWMVWMGGDAHLTRAHKCGGVIFYRDPV